MLKKARRRVVRNRLNHVEAVLEMDASDMDFPDNSFDIVVAMYVLTVVPDPIQVMRELERVCRPGGQVFVVNHFSQDHGVRGVVEKAMGRFGEKLGWRPEFPVETLMVCDRLKLVETQPMRPFGLFTIMRFVKDAADGTNAAATPMRTTTRTRASEPAPDAALSLAGVCPDA
jgi:phosphatidylethanolamine/phosphatidyl-N-methylethanolamine N-methyltransferase